MIIIKCANHNDAEAILDLQKCAYASEAEIYNDYTIPPLTQTLDEIKNEIREQNFLKALEEDSNTNIVKIVGSVRAYAKDNTAFIGRLMVEPKLQNRGIGTLLMKDIEQQFTPRHQKLRDMNCLQVTKVFVTYVFTKSLVIENSKEYL